MELYEIIKILEKKKIRYYIEEDENERDFIIVYSCCLGDNFYDYGEEEKDLKIDDIELEFLENEPKVYIIRCSSCSQCAGW